MDINPNVNSPLSSELYDPVIGRGSRLAIGCTSDITIDRTVSVKRFNPIPLFTILIANLLAGGGAYAQDTPAAEKCFPVKTATDNLKAASLKPEKRDHVDSFLKAFFADVETRSLPMKLYIKSDDAREDFIVRETGGVQDFQAKILAASPEAQICGLAREDGKIGLGMSTSVRFKNQSGTHTLAEILDGLKDGKSHHKKNLGGAKAMFVPKMTHIAIIYDDPLYDDSGAAPVVTAIAGGETTPVALERYSNMWVADVDSLEDSDVETITIGGGTYELHPVPSIKKMKALGIE